LAWPRQSLTQTFKNIAKQREDGSQKKKNQTVDKQRYARAPSQAALFPLVPTFRQKNVLNERGRKSQTQKKKKKKRENKKQRPP